MGPIDFWSPPPIACLHAAAPRLELDNVNNDPTELPLPQENEGLPPECPDDGLVDMGKVSRTKGGVFGLTNDPGPGYIWA